VSGDSGAKYSKEALAARQREAELQDRVKGKTNPVTTEDVTQRHITGGETGEPIRSRIGR
jgi:hypothetical protein